MTPDNAAIQAALERLFGKRDGECYSAAHPGARMCSRCLAPLLREAHDAALSALALSEGDSLDDRFREARAAFVESLNRSRA